MSENEETYTSNCLYFSFEGQDIKSIFLDFSFANIVVIEGESFSVESRGITNSNLICKVKEDGTLIIKNDNLLEQFDFTKHDRRKFIPRILVTIPKDFYFESWRVNLNAGSFLANEINSSCKSGAIRVNAGQIRINSLKGGKIDFACAAGSINFSGNLEGRSNVDCGMGSINLNIKDSINNYSCDARVGLGSVKLNEELLSTLGHSYADKICDNHISVNCGMGSVNLNIHTF